MHKDEVKGAAKRRAAGSMKEAVGKATGNDRMAAEGASERLEGKVQKGVELLQGQAARDALRK